MVSSGLRIAVVAHVRHPVASPFMGGMEAHCDLLVRALQAAGHQVTLFASGDSAADLPVKAITDTAYEAELPWALWHGSPRLREWLDEAYARCWAMVTAGGFDIVHNNSLSAALPGWALRDRIAMVTSLHVPPFKILRDAIADTRAPWSRYTVASDSQMPLWDGTADGAIDVAHNGIDLNRWRFAEGGNGRAIWFGRITPNKGTVAALRAADAAGIGLDVIGPVECSDYYAEVAPLLRGSHRYLGHLSGAALSARVAEASVMLCTPMWDEPFGLVAADALACGVPVAALDRGAMAEVLGTCGALAADEAALPGAIRAALMVPRAQCRARAEAHFGADAMVRRYERSYAAAMAGLSRPSSSASTRALLA